MSLLQEQYGRYVRKKKLLLITLFFFVIIFFIIALSIGSVHISLSEIIETLCGRGNKRTELILWNIRLPQVLTAIVAGIGLSLGGIIMQSTLKNPLASPFTLGISHAAAFGAALSVICFGAGAVQSSSQILTINNPYLTTGMAFLFSLLATVIILIITRIKRGSPEVIVLAGVAIGSLFTAGTALLQYVADDSELSSIIFWSFGDAARASWGELLCISITVLISLIYFYVHRWQYNALMAGDETAKGVGISAETVRITGMIVTAIVTSTVISFLGVIGFVGLICPHMARRIIGDDHTFLIPFGALLGAFVLLFADTVGRTIIAPHIMPVAILTSFLGAPAFLYLLVRKN